MTGRTVLVTGAAGLLGAEVTARLAAAGDAVIALTHGDRADIVRNDRRPVSTFTDGPPRPGRVLRLDAEVTTERLGLPDRRYADLVSVVDIVVHCAAVTRFGLPAQRYQAVNETGTARVLDLVTAGSAAMVHVSTAYVCGERDGWAGELEADVGQRFGNAYERSKLRAELLARAAGAGVVRPSIVAGTGRTGAIREFSNLYVLIKLAAEGRLRTLPGRYDALLDLVPVDRAATMIADVAVQAPRFAGTTIHAVGYEVSVRDLSDVLAEYPSFHVPTIVPPAGFDPGALPPVERRYYFAVGELYAPYLRRRVRFDDACARIAGYSRPNGTRAYLRRLIDHGLRAGFLGRPATAEDLAEVTTR